MGAGEALGVQVGAGRARGWACWALGRQALGRAGRAGARQALACRRAGQAAAGARLGGRALGAGRTGRWALRAGLARQGQAACAVLAGRARALIFKPVFRLGIFPESPNEHCSL